MSGSGHGQSKCSCPNNHCLRGNCNCFKAKLVCSGNCKCHDCRNTENNKADVESLYNEYLKRKSPPVVSDRSVPPDGLPMPPGFSGCRCRRSKCAGGKCACFGHFRRCTSKCKCRDCANGSELGGSDTNTEPGQGGAGGVSNVPDEAVQTAPPSNIESELADDTSSMAGELPQMEEHPTQPRDNRDSGPNKRPRNK